jgi:putative colanic acid biosysnthesis UDP-glucose lipid carrier transferase
MLYPLLDATAIAGSLLAIKWLASGFVDNWVLLTAWVAAATFVLAGQFTGLYRRWQTSTPDRELLCIVSTWFMALLVLALLGFYSRYSQFYARSEILIWTIVGPSIAGLARMLMRTIQAQLFQQGFGTRRVAIAGFNPLGFQVARNCDADTPLGLKVQGFYDDRHPDRLMPTQAHDLPEVLGDLKQAIHDCRSGKIDIVLVTLPMRAEKRIQFLLEALSDSTASVYIVPDFFVFELLHSRWTSVGGIPAVSVFENPFYGVDGLFKRTADILLGLAALCVAAVPMVLVALAVKLTSKGPILFKQRRYGLDGREIRVWKFRSMRVCDDGAVVKQATKEDPRITPVGRFIRKTSLDELPQLFNVIEGTMSLVGPRPHATAHNEQYRRLIRGYMLRHKVKPGITGLAQVSGCRGETDTIEKMQKRVDYDHRYIREWSLWLDLKILARTALTAWRQAEAY